MSELIIKDWKKRAAEPICLTCVHCLKIEKARNRRYDIDCSSNPNLGGVTNTLSKCRGYRKK